MLNIDKLLKKKGWKGRELGRLEVVNMIDGYRQSLEGVKDPVRLISEADFSKMLSTLKDPTEGRIFNGYIAIHEWFARVSPMAIMNYQQALLNLNKLVYAIHTATVAEDIYKYIEELPAILTEKQYKDLVEKRKAEILHPDGGEIGFNIFNMLQEAIDYYINQLQKEPRKKNPLKPLKKKLEQELVTDPRILANYNRVMGNGYYTLPDGTRSDSMSLEEWQKLLKDVVEDVRENPDIEDEEKEAIIQDIVEARYLTRVSAIYDGATEEEADHIQTETDIANGFSKKCEWHYYEEAPEDLNKWEILETGDLFKYYTSLAGELTTDEEIIADMKAFKEEFPEVVEALLKDMEKYTKGVSSLPVEEWLTTVYAWEDLYNADFYGFRSTYTDDTAIFNGNKRAIFNGIAILRPSNLLDKSPRIEPTTGYYTAPDIRGAVSPFSLDSYFTDSEDYAQKLDELEEATYLFLSAYYFLNGYNKALELTAQYYDLEEFKTIDHSKQVKVLEEKLEAYNSMIKLLYAKIKETDYEDKEYKKKKLEVLKDVITPISLKEWKLSKDAIEKAKANITDFKPYKGQTEDLMYTLCYRYVTNEKGEITW